MADEKKTGGPGGLQKTQPLTLFALLVGILPLVLRNEYYTTVLIFMGINIILVIGLNLLMGYAGQISLGHAAFFACDYSHKLNSKPKSFSIWMSFSTSRPAVVR